jgi:amidase
LTSVLSVDSGITDGFELNEITIGMLQDKFASGEYTSEQITGMYLERIKEIDKNGPVLKAVIEINPDALSIACGLDKERKLGNIRGPLHGIPVLIKDNIDTADKMETTAGSLAMVGNYAAKDAFFIHRLREAGAVILGKTNLSEWANFRSTRSVSGWSSRGGQTRNPYILDRSPCGSSSGSAVAVAANLCVVAIGTETDGSIACPASMNGIVGIKPTVGLVSRSGIIPISCTQDTAGPFARSVADAAILLGVIAGMDPEDKTTLSSKGKGKKEYAEFLLKDGLNGKRIGVEKTFLNGNESITEMLEKALNQMRQAGVTIEEVEFMDQYNKSGNDEFNVLMYEFKDGLNKYLASSNARVRSLQDVIDFNLQHADTMMAYFKQEILIDSQNKGELDSPDYLKSLHQSNGGMKECIDKIMNDKNLDALCGPATGPAWCIDPINGDFWTGYGTYGAAAVAGYPSITVPMGSLDGLPVGITFLGKAYDEPSLISIAYAYEQISKNRILPGFKKSFIA